MTHNELPTRTEVLVIGAGPGGYAAAFEAARLGRDVTLVNEEDELGGVCLRRGCIPSKTLLHLSELVHATKAAASAGLTFESPRVELDRIREHKDSVIDQLTGGVAQLCRQRGVRVIRARATFEDNRTVRLEGDSNASLSFEHAIIATGSRPVPLPGTAFGGRIMSSKEALELEDIPDSLLVIGGGYIGLEMGMVYQALGSKVTLAEMTDRLMPNTDADLVEPLSRTVERLFEAVHLNARASDMQASGNGVQVTIDTGDDATQHEFDRVLIAIGRQPNTDSLNLEATDVTLDDNGFIRVDGARRTEADNIYAIGDAAGGMLLAHKAMHEGKVAARAIAGQNAVFDALAVPAVVFTDPQVAWCGLTEQQAGDETRNVEVLRFPWQASGRAVSMGASQGLTKLLVDADTGRVLGVGIVGPQAESLIAEAVLAIEMGATAEDLALSIHPHPTLTETLGEAAELLTGQATHYG
ncbi:dihydrolipoyl dehydrogenase [Marinobacter halodurans]|uniref:Dihydrolipoyl dehydrogenase n=1 Tax=Marinobacter halodurans TaxID=2528979 RepID=A0ABY1ZFC4_9GAMM|nr:dihydrolipoyl dehydrogenase [Marinobacter halodurans]TBW49385.1 dihydrolipoyl dehydrogenase [Marinobacter halodurans]